MTEPYPCPKCGEMLIKLETNLSKSGYPIPTNFYDGEISKRGEGHKCKANQLVDKVKKQVPPYVNEKSHDLHEYMKNYARLGADGWWHLWRNGKYAGPVEYAPNDHKSWEPEK
jgi:hypothetical protein